MHFESNLRGIKTLAYSSMSWKRNEAAPDTVRQRCRGGGMIRHIPMPEVLQGDYLRCAGADVGAVQGGDSHGLYTLLARAFS